MNYKSKKQKYNMKFYPQFQTVGTKFPHLYLVSIYVVNVLEIQMSNLKGSRNDMPLLRLGTIKNE